MTAQDSFLGFDFVELTMENQEILEAFFVKYPQNISKYTFASCIAWAAFYKYAWMRFPDDTLLIRAYIESLNQYHLLQPIGVFSKQTQTALLKALEGNGYPIRIFAVFGEMYAELRATSP